MGKLAPGTFCCSLLTKPIKTHQKRASFDRFWGKPFAVAWEAGATLTGRMTVHNKAEGKTTGRRTATRRVTRSLADESRTARATANVTWRAFRET
jgi:hypothetical protein